MLKIEDSLVCLGVNGRDTEIGKGKESIKTEGGRST